MYTRTLHSTVTGARLAVSGARLAHSPCCYQKAYRPRTWMTVQPAPCPVPAKAEAHLHAYRQDVQARGQVKIYCIPECDAHIYIIIYIYLIA